MNFKNFVVILGAGASKGAMLEEKETPPLDDELLPRAKHLFGKKGLKGNGKRAWMNFIKHMGVIGLQSSEVVKWRLEQLSTYLEARIRMNALQIKAGQPAKYHEALSSLNKLICYVFVKTGGIKPCKLHKKIFEFVKPNAVLSFNYDIIADQSLMEMGKLQWTNKEYAGSNTIQLNVNDNVSIRPLKKKKFRSCIRLLKLHGSMHWAKHKKGGKYSLSGFSKMPYEKQFDFIVAPDAPLIVPPVAAKMEISETILRKRWSAALQLLKNARGWIIWGYSFPETDTAAAVLFRTALQNNKKPKPVYVINPDAKVASRVKTILSKVDVVSCPSAERFLLDNHQVILSVDKNEENKDD